MMMNFSPRPVIWLGNSRKNIRAFPKIVQKEFGGAIFVAQCGGMPDHDKPLKGIGSGVLEIIERYDTDTYRVVYAVQFRNAVYILHVFQKKSKKGIKTSQQDIKLIKQRFQQAQNDSQSSSQ